eukprot:TRINITY_DN2826_c1_g1_i22.p1 TRINITY_DN2826_c1_g1~~TRINITY_DN2826_c1_g1_i22.p1  ORF type:complete len:101 (+),score=12.47 TRINITY_DN2826_c1_g1_i22:101-403(+)
MASHSPYAYVPVSSYLQYSGLQYPVISTPSPPPIFLTQLPSPHHRDSTAGIMPEAGLPKKHGRRKKKRDSLKKAQVVSTPEIGRAVQQECRDRSRMPSSA